MGINEFSPKDARQSIASITNTEGQYGCQYGYPKASCLRIAENLAKTNGNPNGFSQTKCGWGTALASLEWPAKKTPARNQQLQ